MANELVILVDRVNRAILDERNVRVAFTTALSIHKPRIFEKGKAANESQIGKYSTKPASISKKQQARQTGKTYFKGGYAEYKSAVGKNPGFVILRNTDQMYHDYGLQGSGNNLGIGFKNQFNADKSVWVEDHFNKDIFQFSEKEKDIFVATLKAQIRV